VQQKHSGSATETQSECNKSTAGVQQKHSLGQPSCNRNTVRLALSEKSKIDLDLLSLWAACNMKLLLAGLLFSGLCAFQTISI